MNTYKKFCPNVFVAQCESQYQKGNEIIVTTKRGKENEHIIHNLVGKTDTHYFYSITRADGFDSQERAKNKIDKIEGWAESAEARADEWRGKAEEGKDFLVLAEPIKIGHHSEKKHRALIERNHNRMNNAMDELRKAESHRDRLAYWEKLAEKIDLSMPESLNFFKVQLEEATEYHKGLKSGDIEREHSYSLTYAKKRVNDLKKKFKLASLLWGE